MTNISRLYLIFCLFCLICFVLVGFSFSFSQNLWVDESTQLSGLSLSLADIYLWLGAFIENPFPVPADRMPVLSYYWGSLWGSFFGFDVITMRWSSLCCVFLGLILLTIYFVKSRQVYVLLPALLLLCFSANLTVVAVEIRAYALFFFWSILSAILFVDLISREMNDRDQCVRLSSLAIVLALAINTHFYGLILSGSIALTYLLFWFFEKRLLLSLKAVVVVAGILLLAIALAAPAIYASLVISADDGSQSVEGFGILSVVKLAIKLIYRLVAHQTMAEVSFVPWAALALVYGVIVFSTIIKPAREKLALICVLGLGFLVVFLAAFFVKGFDVLAPHYNIWMLPFLALLFAYSVVDLSLKIKNILLVSLLLLLSVGQWHLLVDGEKYAHTRFSEVQQRVEKFSSEGSVAVVYNFSAALTWFAGRYAFSEQIGQFTVKLEGEGSTYMDLQTEEIISPDVITAAFDTIIMVYGENQYSKALVNLEPSSPLPRDSEVYSLLDIHTIGWETLDSGSYAAQQSADILIYGKAERSINNQ